MREKQRSQPKAAAGRQPDRHAHQRGDRASSPRSTTSSERVETARRRRRRRDSRATRRSIPGLFVDTRGWADDAARDVAQDGAAQRRHGRADPAAHARTKDDTGNAGLEELLEGDGDVDRSRARQERRPARGRSPTRRCRRSRRSQTSGRMAAHGRGSDGRRRSPSASRRRPPRRSPSSSSCSCWSSLRRGWQSTTSSTRAPLSDRADSVRFASRPCAARAGARARRRRRAAPVAAHRRSRQAGGADVRALSPHRLRAVEPRQLGPAARSRC